MSLTEFFYLSGGFIAGYLLAVGLVFASNWLEGVLNWPTK